MNDTELLELMKSIDPQAVRVPPGVRKIVDAAIDIERTMKKLIFTGEAMPASKRLIRACSDCPLRRDALSGWLGGSTPEEYTRLCHSDAVVKCHVHAGSRCAGLAIYRKNTCKSQPSEHALPGDHVSIFSNLMQFIEHRRDARLN